MKSRASRAVPFYIFSASSFFRAKWHKFCFLCALLKSRRREKCFDFGVNRHRKSLCYEPFRRSPSRPFNASSSRAYLLYSLIYTLSTLPILSVLLSSHFPPLLHAAPSPRCPFSTPTLVQPSLPLLSLRSLRSAFAPSAPSAPSVRFVFKRKSFAFKGNF